MSYWSVLLPESSDVTNLVTNPSIELATTNFTAVGGSVARSSAASKRGGYSLAITPTAGVNDGAYYGTVALTSGTSYTWSVDIKGVNGIPYKIYFADTSGTLKGTATTHTGTGEWARVTVTWACDGTASYRLYVVKNNDASTGVFYVDGLLCVAKGYDLRYFDGESEGAYWNGTKQASTSVMSCQERKSGRWYDLVSDLSLTLRGEMGHGVAPAKHQVHGQSLLPGALFEGRKTLPRTLDLKVQAKGSSYANLATLRKGLVNKLKPHAVKGDQPFLLKYTGANSSKALELEAVYDSGLEATDADMYLEEFNLRCLAYDPFFYEEGECSSHLTMSQTLSGLDDVAQRLDGVWSEVHSSGMSDGVLALAVGPDGTLYAGGEFATAGGVTVNYIAKWDGSAWSTVGGTSCNGVVNDLLITPDGTLYAGGEFTTAPDGTAVNRIAKWNGSAWSALGTGLSARCVALAFGLDGSIYAGGSFTTAGGTTVNNVAKWNGSAWSALGSTAGVGSDVYTLAVGIDGSLYAGGAFTTAGGSSALRVAKWNGSAWSALGTGMDSSVYALAIDADGKLYAGGLFTTAGGVDADGIAEWNGAQWASVGGSFATGGYVYSILIDPDSGFIYVGGTFTDYLGRLAVWNGSTWAHVDGELTTTSGTIYVYAIAKWNKTIYLGLDSPGTISMTTSYQNTVTNNGSETAYPVLYLKRSGGTSASVYYLENVTTGKIIWLDYDLLDGEELVIDFRPGKRSCVSSYFGDVWRAVLRNSDVADFNLLPGSNLINAYVAQVGSPTMTGYLKWRNTHESADGAAA